MHNKATHIQKIAFHSPFKCEKLKCFDRCRQNGRTQRCTDGQTDIVKPICHPYKGCVMKKGSLIKNSVEKIIKIGSQIATL